MKILVCGAGQVGFNIARHLTMEGNDVVVIDTSPELVRRINDNLDAQGVVGHASRPDVLQRAGIADADMIIAVTQTDEVNMVACQVAHSLFEVPIKIARVRSRVTSIPPGRTCFRASTCRSTSSSRPKSRSPRRSFAA